MMPMRAPAERPLEDEDELVGGGGEGEGATVATRGAASTVTLRPAPVSRASVAAAVLIDAVRAALTVAASAAEVVGKVATTLTEAEVTVSVAPSVELRPATVARVERMVFLVASV
jgi:hypothetical protein